MTVQTTTRDKAQATDKAIQVVFPVTANPAPKALVIHCADVRFRKAFRNFIEGKTEAGCLGLREEDYVNLIIPGGIASLADILALPKQFKVTKEQIEFLLEHFPSITTVVLINHEDCAAYKLVKDHVGSSFLRNFATMLDRQKVDLIAVAKQALKLSNASIFKLYMAKFADPAHTKVRFDEVTL